MCRLGGCRNPARIRQKTPSKYCCDEHGIEFMRAQFSRCRSSQARQSATAIATKNETDQSRPGTEQRTELHPDSASSSLAPAVHPGHRSFEGGAGSAYDYDDDDDNEAEDGGHDEGEEEVEDPSYKGGVLSVAELKALVSFVSAASEFSELGNEDSVYRYFDMGDYDDTAEFTAKEQELLDALRRRHDGLKQQHDMLVDREKLLGIVRQRAKSLLETLRRLDGKDEWKDICGYDSRLSWSDEEFDDWRVSGEGKSVLENGTFAVDIVMGDAATDVDGHGDGETADVDRSSLTENVCLKRRCERHKQWVKVQQQDIAYESRVAKEDLGKCQQAISDLMRRVRFRLSGAGLNEDNPAVVSAA